MISRVKLVSIPVRDQQRAVEFYTAKLGFRVTTDAPFDGKQRWIELTLPGGSTRVVLFTPPGAEQSIGSFSNVVFTSDDIERTYEELRARGVEFVQPLKREEWGTGCVFKDVDGNMFALTSDVEVGIADRG
jgi:catechol 2,3-dioxygenase-like lactoylglutathione lyase family enzyme